jgi:LPXTG-motif cell wall-anchored protein
LNLQICKAVINNEGDIKSGHGVNLVNDCKQKTHQSPGSGSSGGHTMTILIIIGVVIVVVLMIIGGILLFRKR